MIETGLILAGLWILIFRKAWPEQVHFWIFNRAHRLVWIWEAWSQCAFCFSLSLLVAYQLVTFAFSPTLLGSAFVAYAVISISDAAACVVKRYVHEHHQD